MCVPFTIAEMVRLLRTSEKVEKVIQRIIGMHVYEGEVARE
jgi:hypothetical protein